MKVAILRLDGVIMMPLRDLMRYYTEVMEPSGSGKLMVVMVLKFVEKLDLNAKF